MCQHRAVTRPVCDFPLPVIKCPEWESWSKKFDGTQDLVLLKRRGLSGFDGYGSRGLPLWLLGKALTAGRRSQLSSPGAARHWRWRLWIVEMDSCDTAYLDGDNSGSVNSGRLK